MMRFVVDDQNVSLAAQLFEHAATERCIAFHAALHNPFRAAVVLGLEEMPIGDLKATLLQPLHHPARHQVKFLIVVAGLPGEEHLQAFSDGEIGTYQEHRIGEAPVLGIGQLVQHLPGDDHAHDDGLAGACGHLTGVPGEIAILRDGDALFFRRRGFDEPDEGLDGFALTEKQLALPIWIVPVIEQLPGDGCHAGVAALPPRLDPFPDGVDLLQRDELFL
jgi:hypothetical protein